MKRALLALAILAAVIALYAYMRRPTPSEAERNRAFAESMNGVTLAGNSTTLSSPGRYGSERYRIEGVTHVSGDLWLLRAGWNYHGTDITVPIPLKIQWAGDTPVITLTDLSIPGMGTYTARSSFTETNMPEPGVVRRAAVRSSARSSAIPSLLISGRRPQS